MGFKETQTNKHIHTHSAGLEIAVHKHKVLLILKWTVIWRSMPSTHTMSQRGTPTCR